MRVTLALPCVCLVLSITAFADDVKKDDPLIGDRRLSEWKKLLIDPSDETRRSSAEALGKIGPKAKAAVPALIAALKDAKSFVRTDAAEALGGIGPDAKSAVPALIAALKDNEYGEWGVQRAAAYALGEIGPDAKAAVPALMVTLKHKQTIVRFWAANALGRIGPAAKPAIPALKELVNDPAAAVSAAAQAAVLAIEKR